MWQQPSLNGNSAPPARTGNGNPSSRPGAGDAPAQTHPKHLQVCQEDRSSPFSGNLMRFPGTYSSMSGAAGPLSVRPRRSTYPCKPGRPQARPHQSDAPQPPPVLCWRRRPWKLTPSGKGPGPEPGDPPSRPTTREIRASQPIQVLSYPQRNFPGFKEGGTPGIGVCGGYGGECEAGSDP